MLLSSHFLIIGLTILSAGCSGARSRPSCSVGERARLRVVASDRVNPDPSGRPLPTVLRVYQLSNMSTVETASFAELWEHDEDTLGDALLTRDEFTIYPETTTNRRFERAEDANFIVGMAVFRRPMGTAWRTVLELPPPVEEARCAALQENPDEAPLDRGPVSVRFELDDFQIVGALQIDEPRAPCGDDDPICQAERNAESEEQGVTGGEVR